jgi:anti-sigma regulatory factor (Ser/Thr protein kinase)
VSSIGLTANPTSSHAARNFVAGTLKRWGREDLSEVAVLLTSELVTNAILHAGTDVVVTVRMDGDHARVAVHDNDVTPPRRREGALDGGRGLTLVDALAGSWGSSPNGDGKAVWFEV